MRRVRFLALLLIVALLTGGCGSEEAATKPPGPPPKVEPTPPPTPPPQPASPLTGLPVSEEVAKRRPVAVMIGNSAKERPQDGLSRASVVYEILAEGGITRLMGLYLDNDAQSIGPVRSARHYFLYATAGHGAVYAHCGGSPQALVDLKTMAVQDLDDMRDRGVMWRTRDRVAPYNLYTSTANLRYAMDERRWSVREPVPAPWGFRDEAASGRSGASVRIPYPNGINGYTVQYDYDADLGMYRRSIDGRPHEDADGTQINVKTVIVIYVKTWLIPNDKDLRVDMELVGSGKGLCVSDGKTRDITWSKKSKASAFEFKEADGSKLQIRRGNVWVQVVPPPGTTLGS
jgi:hypothetical protein